jgi:hypothetical protein
MLSSDSVCPETGKEGKHGKYINRTARGEHLFHRKRKPKHFAASLAFEIMSHFQAVMKRFDVIKRQRER